MVTFQTIKWELVSEDSTTLIYAHGLTVDNKRVTVLIPDFKPYIYLELDSDVNWTNSKIDLLLAFLKKEMKGSYAVKNKFVERIKNYYYKRAKFLWLAFNSITDVYALERVLNKKPIITGLGRVKLQIHEKNAGALLQLFAMRKLKPTGWITATQTTKAGLIEEYGDTFSMADIQVVSSYSNISPCNEMNNVVNPLILSYDIECISGDSSGDTFPNPRNPDDQIICICATVAHAQDDETQWQTYSFVNEIGDKKCPDVLSEGVAKIYHFKNERDLLIGWSKFIRDINPDVITGYNTLSFDDNYMAKRAEKCNILPSFLKMGRLYGKSAREQERKWTSSAYGQQSFNYLDIPGMLHIDMFPVISKDYTNLQSYTLDSVSELFLGDHKVNLPAKEMIQRWHNGDSTDMHDIIHYCNKDTILPLKLMKKLNTWLGLTEMSNVMMVQIFDLVTRGQQIRVFSQLYTRVFDMNIVCLEKWADYKPTEAEKEFVGAIVQDPKVGYWEMVATYDFKSLYPTTIIAYNLCFSTFIPPGENPPESDYHLLEWSDHCFCEHDKTVRKTKAKGDVICKSHSYRFYKSSVKKGIVPMLLEDLLDARARSRKELKVLESKMKDLTDVELQNAKLYAIVLDKRQNSYKIAANSVYGGFGSDFSYVPFYPAAASTTAMGRKSIQQAISFAKDYRKDTVLVYGDSVTSDTPVFVQKDGELIIKEIKKIHDGQWCSDTTFKPIFTEPIPSKIEYHVMDDGPAALLAARHLFHADQRWCKEYAEPEGIYTWTSAGWSKVRKIIRHKTAKKIYKVITNTGIVNVTSDHSLLTPEHMEVKPCDLKKGTILLSGYPLPDPVCSDYLLDFHNNQLTAAYSYYDHYKNRRCVQLAVEDDDVIRIHQGDACTPGTVTSVICLGETNDYVYDLETERGDFCAGVGNLIVKNTDSCMLHFSTVRDLGECFKICENMEHEINKIFPKPMYLELEKIYSKYFLLSKKKYVGYIVDKAGVITSVDKKGVVLKRRDNCNLLRTIYHHLIEMIMEKQPRWRVYKYLHVEIDKLLSGKVLLDDLIITKSIKSNYKADNLPHVAVAAKMKERGKYVTAGTRIRYIFVCTEGRDDPQYVKAEDPDWYNESGGALKIDYLYYFEKQLINPIDDALNIKFGTSDILKNLFKLLKRGCIKNAADYFTPKYKIID